MRPDPTATPERIVSALDRLSRAHRAHRQATASRLGLTALQLDILGILADGVPPLPHVGLLADELGVAQPTVTDSLKAMERKGLVNREAAKGDRRRTVAALTAKGRSVLRKASAGDDLMVEAVGRMNPDQQTDTLVSLLGVIGRYLEEGVINVGRTCLTCRYHTASHCSLLDIALTPSDLRVNCPEHQSVLTSAG